MFIIYMIDYDHFQCVFDLMIVLFHLWIFTLINKFRQYFHVYHSKVLLKMHEDMDDDVEQ